MRSSAHIVFALFAALVVFGEARTTWAQSSSLSLTPQEQADLAAGRLVKRPESQRVGGVTLMGGTSMQKVAAPPDVVFEAVLDFSRYPQMLPWVDSAIVVEEAGAERLILVTHSHRLVRASYHIRFQVRHSSRTALFRVDRSRPGSVRTGSGFVSVVPFEGGQSSVVAFGVMADPSLGILTDLLRPQVQAAVLEVPRAVKQYVERLAREGALDVDDTGPEPNDDGQSDQSGDPSLQGAPSDEPADSAE